LSIQSSSSDGSIDDDHDAGTVYSCRVCNQTYLELKSLKVHWTRNHNADLGAFPGAICSDLGGGSA
jgi:hypothetical protein